MYMPYEDVAANAQNVQQFIQQVKARFAHAIEIYERSVANYELPIEKDNLTFELKIGNNTDIGAKFALYDDQSN